MLAINLAEFGSTGAVEMSWFQGLSGGKSCFPWRLAPGPRLGTLVELDVTVRGRVAVGDGVGLIAAPAEPPGFPARLPNTFSAINDKPINPIISEILCFISKESCSPLRVTREKGTDKLCRSLSDGSSIIN